MTNGFWKISKNCFFYHWATTPQNLKSTFKVKQAFDKKVPAFQLKGWYSWLNNRKYLNFLLHCDFSLRERNNLNKRSVQKKTLTRSVLITLCTSHLNFFYRQIKKMLSKCEKCVWIKIWRKKLWRLI